MAPVSLGVPHLPDVDPCAQRHDGAPYVDNLNLLAGGEPPDSDRIERIAHGAEAFHSDLKHNRFGDGDFARIPEPLAPSTWILPVDTGRPESLANDHSRGGFRLGGSQGTAGEGSGGNGREAETGTRPVQDEHSEKPSPSVIGTHVQNVETFPDEGNDPFPV